MAPLLEIKDLKKYFPIKDGIIFNRSVGAVKAVDGVSFSVEKAETLGIVGESGCGKSTTGRVILRLLEATAGEVIFEGRNILNLKNEEMRKLRREMQIIFQDPYASLNPRMTIGDIITEPLKVHKLYNSSAERNTRLKKLLDIVGLNYTHAKRYPHEFSGGQRQRIGIARALAVEPKLIICDEPVSALDVSIQAQVINLLEDLQQEFKLTYIFIAHDLSVVKHISDRIAVMYLGKIVEMANYEDLYKKPLHPYTIALLSAIPVPDPTFKRNRIILEGDIPSPANPPAGCRFHTRCAFAKDICKTQEPEFKEIELGHSVACHLAGQLN